MQALLQVPSGFRLRAKLQWAMQRRRTLLDRPEVPSIDWATAEVLAFASILADGIAIRLTGEDAARGTFSQRHAVFHDVQTGATFTPLQALPQARAAFEIQDSPLTENATVGFEYGYNIQEPGRLVLWEAQYGDFINGAQVIIREGAELLHPGDGARRTLLARVTAHQIDSDLTAGHHAKEPVAPSPGGVLLAGTGRRAVAARARRCPGTATTCLCAPSLAVYRSPSGRITKDDVQAYVQQHRPLEQPTAHQAIPPAAIPSSTGTRREERQQMSRRRRTIARRLVDSRESVQFLARVKELIEDPEALLLEG